MEFSLQDIMDLALKPVADMKCVIPLFQLSDEVIVYNYLNKSRDLIEADLVNCMVAFPGQLFYSTQTKSTKGLGLDWFFGQKWGKLFHRISKPIHKYTT